MRVCAVCGRKGAFKQRGIEPSCPVARCARRRRPAILRECVCVSTVRGCARVRVCAQRSDA
eukprot:1905429-Rhodomonas_salina.1